MIESPQDKMIRTGDLRTKRGKKAVSQKKTRRYFFPHFGRSVVASSEEEARKIISKKLK